MYKQRIEKLPAYALGFNAMLVGAPGSGKTTVIASLLRTGMEVFVVFTEANGQTNLMKACRELKLTETELSRLHMKYVSATTDKFSTLSAAAELVKNSSEFGKITGGSRARYDQLIRLMKVCQKFVDQNEVDYGAVDTWGPERVLVLDSLSGLNDMAMSIVVGDKPIATQQDWQVAMKQEMDMVKACINSTCSFVMTGHLAQEKDEVSGRIIVTPLALGQKNGPALMPLFGDIVLCEKNGGAFSWATTSPRVECLKNSFLPLKDKLKPDFCQLVDQWLIENGV